MALGTIGAAVASSAASAGVNFGLSKLFGRKDRKAINRLGSAPSIGINAGGLSGRLGNISSSAERRGLVDNISRGFADRGALLGDLRKQVTPGFGRLTEARVGAIENRRRRAIGNLKENLQRRRALGSSFGQDALLRAEAEFAQEEGVARSETFLQELQQSRQLISEEFAARSGEFQTLLDEFNIQAEAALKLVSGAQAQLGANQRQQAVLAAESLKGTGAFFEPLANSIGKFAGSLFSGGSSGIQTDAAGRILGGV